MLTIVVLALLLAAEAAAFTVGPSLSPTRTATSHSAPRATQVRMCSEGQDAVTRRTAICRMAVHATAVGAPATAFAAEQNGVPPVDPAWAAHDGPFTDSDFAGFKQTASGLKYKDVLEGTGASPQAADTVRAHYCGYLLTGEIFDTSYRPALFPFSLVSAAGPPTAFKLGRGGLIPGFEEGLLGMKVGGKRICYIPAQLAYGQKGGGPIPPDADLVFYLELRSIGSGASL